VVVVISNSEFGFLFFSS